MNRCMRRHTSIHRSEGERDEATTYTWLGSSWQSSACEADVMATRSLAYSGTGDITSVLTILQIVDVLEVATAISRFRGDLLPGWRRRAPRRLPCPGLKRNRPCMCVCVRACVYICVTGIYLYTWYIYMHIRQKHEDRGTQLRRHSTCSAPQGGSNPWPYAYEAHALPAELRRPCYFKFQWCHRIQYANMHLLICKCLYGGGEGFSVPDCARALEPYQANMEGWGVTGKVDWLFRMHSSFQMPPPSLSAFFGCDN